MKDKDVLVDVVPTLSKRFTLLHCLARRRHWTSGGLSHEELRGPGAGVVGGGVSEPTPTTVTGGPE